MKSIVSFQLSSPPSRILRPRNHRDGNHRRHPNEPTAIIKGNSLFPIVSFYPVMPSLLNGAIVFSTCAASRRRPGMPTALRRQSRPSTP